PGEGEVRDNLVRLAEACSSYSGRVFPLFAGLAGHPELLEQAMTAVHTGTTGPQDVISALAEHLRAEQSLGRLNPTTDAEATAVLLFGGCQVAVMAGHSGSPSGKVGTAALVDALLAGARPAG